MFDSLVFRIRQRSREQYQDLVRTWITDLRIWIQEHPEPAFLVALVGGIAFVILFKFLLFLAGVAAVAGFIIYAIALPEGAVTGSSSSAGGSDPDSGPSNPYGPHGVQ